MKILVIDDNNLMTEAISDYLGLQSTVMDHAHYGETAVRLALKND